MQIIITHTKKISTKIGLVRVYNDSQAIIGPFLYYLKLSNYLLHLITYGSLTFMTVFEIAISLPRSGF
jgi:hypothetical protein